MAVSGLPRGGGKSGSRVTPASPLAIWWLAVVWVKKIGLALFKKASAQVRKILPLCFVIVVSNVIKGFTILF